MTARNRQGKTATALALVGTLAGVLIWQKLRLSTNMPRAAYAEPKGEDNAKQPKPDLVVRENGSDELMRFEPIEIEPGQVETQTVESAESEESAVSAVDAAGVAPEVYDAEWLLGEAWKP